MNIKVLHSACLLRPSMGILKQMEEEEIAAKKLKIDWMVKFFVPKGQELKSSVILEANYVNSKYLKSFLYKLFSWFMIRIEYYLWLLKQKDVDVILIRYSVHDIFQLLFLLVSKKPIFLVHHTLEEPELEMNKSFIGKIRFFAEKIIGKLCIRASRGIIGVTNEIIEYEKSRVNGLGKKSYLFPNGININNLTNDFCYPSKEKKILFIASEFSEWHGLDLLFADMKTNNQQFELHLIGQLLPKDYTYAIGDSRVILHGIKDKKFIEQVSSECNIALGSFALERKNMKEACTLKVRDYLNFGLPVYSGHVDVFPSEFKFYKVGLPSITEILKYAEQCENTTKLEVSNESANYIDKAYLVRNLYNDLEKYLTS
ncbi:glycosyltransferase [Acinetobacter indicus]|uniref:glycosyltransferase n=1 Tax=Acinetobacter indicus TaxID=756892 RepID=UPI001443F24F|nr:glycosyltransferase [Acinetobacter indicus]